MKRHDGSFSVYCEVKKASLKTLYNSNYMTLWNRQSCKDSKKAKVWGREGGMNGGSTGVGGSEATCVVLRPWIPDSMQPSKPVVPTTQSEPSTKPLANNNMSVLAHELQQTYQPKVRCQ